MKKILILGIAIVVANASIAQEINPTAPNEHLKYYSGDFTDTDGDGMSDVAEERYGYDPADPQSVVTYDYFLDDGVIAGVGNDPKLSSRSDHIYFRFQDFSPTMKEKTRNFLIKVSPMLYDILGHPAESFICTFKSGKSLGYWYVTNNGRTMVCDSSWDPRLLVHELVHAWKGKYHFTSKGSGSSWRYSIGLYGFEETAEGLAYEILHDYIEAYPDDETTIKILKNGAWSNWSPNTGLYDIIKHQPHLGGGDFWTNDRKLVMNRYSIAAVTVQILQKHDENFFKKMLSLYYEKIESDPNWRPNREDLIELWASVVPHVNGIDTKVWLNALPILRGEKLESRLYPILHRESYTTGGYPSIWLAYADSYQGKLLMTTITKNNLTKFGIPDWFKVKQGYNDNWYLDVRDEPFVVNMTTVHGESVLDYSGKLNDKVNGKGDPNFHTQKVMPTELRPTNFPVGLYKQRLEFPNYTPHTAHSTETYYSFGYKGFKQEKSYEHVLFIGVDSPVAEGVSMQIGDEVHSLPFVNGCAVFRSQDLPMNIEGFITINVTGDGKSHTYQRTLINGGTQDDYRHHQFLIIDRDFNGVEDAYETDVVPLANNNYTSYADVKDETYGFMAGIVAEEPEQVEEPEVVAEVEEPAIDMNVTITADTNGVVIRWDNGDTPHNHYLLLLNGETQVMAGGHNGDYAIIDFARFGLQGTELLRGRFSLVDVNLKFVEWTPWFEINLNDYEFIEEEPEVVAEVEELLDAVDEATEVVEVVFSEPTENNATEVVEVVVVESTKTVEVDVTENPPAPPVVESDWDDAVELESGWKYIEWFGYYYDVVETDWIYHTQLGWVYRSLPSPSFDSVWLWTSKFGWIWTSQNLYSYVYVTESDRWLYIVPEQKIYYDFDLGGWFPWEN